MSAGAEDLIVVRGLGKTYPSGGDALDPIRWLLRSIRGRPPRGRAALEDVSFSLGRGSALGVMGRNGSGKSTLLRLLAGALRPTRGSVSVRGRIGAILDLSAGMHPEFSGRENALLLGILQGADRREVRAQLDAIRQFSGLGEAFEEPMKSYSAGMVLRVAFSTAVHFSPEVLLIDEALAVGDAFFQQRCLRRIRQLRESGRTIVLVSHDPAAIISLCDRAIWLEGGRVAARGGADVVARRYLAARYGDECSLESELLAVQPDPAAEPGGAIPAAEGLVHAEERFGDGRAEVCGLALRDRDGREQDLVGPGRFTRVVITVAAHEHLPQPVIGFTLRNRLGDIVSATNTEQAEISLHPLEPGGRVTVEFGFAWPSLSSGPYTISPAVANGTIAKHAMCDWVENAQVVEVSNPRGLFGWMSLEGVAVRVDRRSGAGAASARQAPAARAVCAESGSP